MIGRTLLCSLCLAPACAAAAPAGHRPDAVFGDWFYLMPDGWRDERPGLYNDPCAAIPDLGYDGSPIYLPVNQPGGGHGGPNYGDGGWMSWYANCLAHEMDAAGAPIALVIRNRNCPIPYHTRGIDTDPDALAQALDALPKLDYLLMDLEPLGDDGVDMVQMNTAEIIDAVRSHPNPRVANAYIGNYSHSPNQTDEALIWPSKRDRSRTNDPDNDAWDKPAFYHQSFNVAMPIAYPYRSFSVHTNAGIQGANVSPNDRSAVFWAPLERVSAAARELPQGHLLVPWFSNYVNDGGNSSYYNAPPPPFEDLEALAQHMRLRGATSYMLWTADDDQTDHPFIGYDLFREIAIESWNSLNDVYELAAKPEILNLETDKRTGLEWSGVRSGDTVWVLVSNLHHAREQGADLPAIPGLPDKTPPVAPGEHMLLTYTVNPAVRDFNNDGSFDTQDFWAFVTSMRDPRLPANSVGGMGGERRDVNSDGLVDLRDVIAIVNAFIGGEYTNSY